jgi:uncharacterized lipoprotein
MRTLKYDIEGLGDKGLSLDVSTPYYHNNSVYVDVNGKRLHISTYMEITSVKREEKEHNWELFNRLYNEWHKALDKPKTDKTSCQREWAKLTEQEQELAYNNFRPFQKKTIEEYKDKVYVKKLYKYLKEKDFNNEFKRREF